MIGLLPRHPHVCRNLTRSGEKKSSSVTGMSSDVADSTTASPPMRTMPGNIYHFVSLLTSPVVILTTAWRTR